MITINNRNTIRIVLFSSFILLNLLLLLAINNVLTYLNSGADRTSMLHLEKETINTYLPKVVWESLQNPGRVMEPTTLKTIERDYLFSWYVKNQAHKTNKKNGIEDYYTTDTRTNLYQSIEFNKKNKIAIESTTLKHNPKLEFYSADGQLVVFTDSNVIQYQKIFQEEKLITEIQDTATYKVMMLLEDGFWRVRHIQKSPIVAFAKDTIKANPPFKVIEKNYSKTMLNLL